MADAQPPVFLTEVPARKSWWAKRVTPSLYVAGRLSERMIKGASEDCFKSIVFVFNNKLESNFGEQRLPPTEQAIEIGKNSCGLETTILCDDLDLDKDDTDDPRWWNVKVVERFAGLLDNLQSPVLLCSNTSYGAAFIALASLLMKNKEPRSEISEENFDAVNAMKDDEVYHRAVGLGFDFRPFKKTIDLLTGFEVTPKTPNLTVPNWYEKYWPARPVFLNWYVVGQVQTDQIGLLEELGTDVLLNTRLGPLTEGKKTQEEVTLLNVGETSKTYTGSGRQTEFELEKHRIDKTKPASYIGPSSTTNYEISNSLEFGDEVGYNEILQKDLMEKASFKYIHMPIVSHGYKIEMYNEYKDQWKVITKAGNIVSQCRTGHRAAVVAVLTLANEHQKSSKWALDKLWDMGFRVNTSDDPDVFILLEYALGPISSSE